MSEALSLYDLAERAQLLERLMADGKHVAEANALQERIEAGYAKVAKYREEHIDDLDQGVVDRATASIMKLEADLALKERATLVPHYFEQILLVVMRDAMKWSNVPEGSRIRVYMPGVFDMTVKLDNVPLEKEIPF